MKMDMKIPEWMLMIPDEHIFLSNYKEYRQLNNISMQCMSYANASIVCVKCLHLKKQSKTQSENISKALHIHLRLLDDHVSQSAMNQAQYLYTQYQSTCAKLFFQLVFEELLEMVFLQFWSVLVSWNGKFNRNYNLTFSMCLARSIWVQQFFKYHWSHRFKFVESL